MKKVIVITGIGDGMGREVAKILSKEGYLIAGFDVDAKSIESLRGELSGEYLLEAMDITDRGGILRFRNSVLKKFGQVDTILSNVGIGFFGPFEETDMEKALKCLEINVIGTAAIFQAFLPAMRKKRQGRLIAMSSLVGQIPFPFESIYSASKFAVEGLVESLQYEVKPFGITVSIVQPAQVSTRFAAKIHHLPPEGSPYRERVRRFINRDNVLIKTAPTPVIAAKKIVNIIKTDKPKLRYQIDFMSSFFLFLNRVLPAKVRDYILINHMDIKV